MIDVNTLSEEEKTIVLARRAYKKAWRDNNKDKVKAANARFYLKQAKKNSNKE